ncbi:MAG: bactofilin family protein [Methylocystaceae bacterium]
MFKAKPRPFEGEHTIIGEDVRIKGEVEANGNVRIEGMVEGHIAISGDLLLGDHGRVLGNIAANNVLVSGKVEGDVKTQGRIEIMTNGQIHGDVNCEALIIDEGGILDGRSTMGAGKKNAPVPVERLEKREKAAK